MYRTFEHTADVGLRIEAATLVELFAEAGRGLMSLIVEDVDRVGGDESRALALEAASLEDLLFDYLSEVLYLFDAEGFVPVRYELETDGCRLRAVLGGGAFDPARDGGGLEVKAITYHGLKVERLGSGYAAEVIVDV